MKVNKFNYFFLIISFLSIVVLSRLIFTLIIFYWNVPQNDDFCFMAKMNDYGTFGSIKWWFMNWQGRFLPQLFTNFILLEFKKFDNMLLYGIVIIFLFCISVYRCIKNLFKKIKLSLSVYDKLVLNIFSLSIFCLLLDFHMDTSTVYWINVSTMYFLGIIFLLLGFSELLNPNGGILSYSILIFSFLYVGCSSEHVALLTLGIFILFSLFQSFFSKNFGNYFFSKKLYTATITCLLSFLIMYFAPGNSVRLASIHHPSFLKGLRNIPEFINILYFNRLSLNAGYLIFTLFFSLAIGSYFSKRLNINSIQLRKLLFLWSGIVLYLITGTILIFSFLLDYKGSTRAFVHISLVITLFIVYFGFIVGIFVNHLQKSYVNFIFFISVSIYFSTVIYKFKFNLMPTIKYEISVRQRLSVVNAMAKGVYPISIVPKLVNSSKNVLLDGELASIMNDNSKIGFNKCLNSAYGLKDKQIILIESH